MKNLIKGLFKYLFLLFLFSVIIFFVGYFYRNQTRPIENLVQRTVVSRILPDTTGTGLAVDTVLTPEQELSIEINRRQQELAAQQSRLDSLEQAYTDSITAVSTLRQELMGMQQTLTQQESDNLDRLAKLYESIKPEQASQILMQLNEQTIAEILFRMSDRQAGKIMGEIDPLMAADITTRLRQLKQQVR